MIKRFALPSLAIILLTACQPKVQTVENEIDTTELYVVKETDSIIIDGAEADTTTLDDSDCVRSHARPIVNKSVYPKTKFKLNDDNHTGTETVPLENGDKLIINNWGCEYYVLTFRFETSRFQSDTTNILFWLAKGHQLLTDVSKGIEQGQLTQGITGIQEFLSTKKSLALGEEIVFNDSEIRNYATVDRIQKINEKRYAIEISFATGPL